MKQVLLHICCAPCAGSVLPRLREMGYEVIFYFQNDNIYPESEYQKRLEEVVRWGKKEKIELITAEYNPKKWHENISGLEGEREGGLRCKKCFEFRMGKTAEVASERAIPYFATTLTNSRYKNAEVINAIGHNFAKKYDLEFIDNDWKKDGGETRSVEISKLEGFFRQNYCGCEYSMRK